MAENPGLQYRALFTVFSGTGCCFQSFQLGADAEQIIKIQKGLFHSFPLCFLPFITDKCLRGNLIEAAMFSPIWFAKETLGINRCGAFSDCWHTHLAIGMLMKTVKGTENRAPDQQLQASV